MLQNKLESEVALFTRSETTSLAAKWLFASWKSLLQKVVFRQRIFKDFYFSYRWEHQYIDLECFYSLSKCQYSSNWNTLWESFSIVILHLWCGVLCDFPQDVMKAISTNRPQAKKGKSSKTPDEDVKEKKTNIRKNVFFVSRCLFECFFWLNCTPRSSCDITSWIF